MRCSSLSMENLSLEVEEAEIEIQDEGDQNEGPNPALCLVGRFLTDGPIRVHIMKERMAGVWHSGRGYQLGRLN